MKIRLIATALAAASFMLPSLAHADDFSLDFTATTTDAFSGGVLINATGTITTSGGQLPVNGIPPAGDPLSVITSPYPGFNVASGQISFNGQSFDPIASSVPDRLLKANFVIIGDDAYYPTAPSGDLLDSFGLAFLATDGSGDYLTLSAPFDLGVAPYELSEYIPDQENTREIYTEGGTLTAGAGSAATPEPASVSLVLTGASSLAGLLWQRRSRVRFAS